MAVEMGTGFLTSAETQDRRRLRALEGGRMDALEDRVYTEFIVIFIGSLMMFISFLLAGALVYYFGFNLFELTLEAFLFWLATRGG